MSTTAVKIVLDTNILVAIIGRKSPFRWLFDKIISGRIILCISNDKHFQVLKEIPFPFVKVLTLTEFQDGFQLE